jgi:hypothetical protein
MMSAAFSIGPLPAAPAAEAAATPLAAAAAVAQQAELLAPPGTPVTAPLRIKAHRHGSHSNLEPATPSSCRNYGSCDAGLGAGGPQDGGPALSPLSFWSPKAGGIDHTLLDASQTATVSARHAPAGGAPLPSGIRTLRQKVWGIPLRLGLACIRSKPQLACRSRLFGRLASFSPQWNLEFADPQLEEGFKLWFNKMQMETGEQLPPAIVCRCMS